MDKYEQYLFCILIILVIDLCYKIVNDFLSDIKLDIKDYLERKNKK